MTGVQTCALPIFPVGEDDSVEQFNLLQQMAKDYGFIHYEISNLAKDGFYSKHNSSYWMQKPYLGLGPSAHSYNGNSREWNPRSISQWKSSVNNSRVNAHKEILSKSDKLNEYLLTSLRTIWGANLSYVEENFGIQIKNRLLKKAEKFMVTGRLELNLNILKIPCDYYIVSDGIISDLFET